jgi:hypothetical protein
MAESRRAEPSNIKKLLIKSNQGGKSIDVSTGLVRLEFYESILQECIAVNLIFMDTGNSIDGSMGVIEGLPVVGGEEVELVMNDNYDQEISIKLNVNKFSSTTQDNLRNVVAMELVTKEFFLNEISRVVKRYDGVVSDSVTKILKDVLKTEKKLIIDATLNKYNFIGNSRKPFYVCMWLCKKSIPDLPNAKGAAAGYFLYETTKGINFKSIDKLLSTEGKTPKKMIYNNSTDIPPGYDIKILDYSVSGPKEGDSGGLDLQSKLMMGAYGSKIRTLNPYDVKYQDKDLEGSKQKKGIKTAGKDFNSNLPTWLKDKPTRQFSNILPIGSLPSGNSVDEQLKDSKKPTFDVDAALIQAPMRYNQLFASKVEITIAGYYKLNAGDIVSCEFPELSGKTNQAPSKRLGGIYMISDICHLVTPKKTFTKLNLVRDSYGK